MESKILSWNVRGVKDKWQELDLLLKDEVKPVVLCLQETKLPADKQDFFLKGYTAHNLIHTDGQIACGGVSVFVDDRTPHRKLELKTKLQAIAVRLTQKSPVTVCSIQG